MPRKARIVAVGHAHHITQRGNYRQTIFTNDAEYSFYLRLLNEYSKNYNLCMLAYCLMPNHVHFVAIPQKEYSLARTFNTCHMRYSQYVNKKNKMTGHLWQGRFFSCVLDERYLYAVVRYIENNPVRAKLVKYPGDWDWSSAKMHLNKETSVLGLEDINKYMDVRNWKEYLLQKEDASVITQVRSNTLSGKPLGDDTFITKLEKFFGITIKSLPRGRPKKKVK